MAGRVPFQSPAKLYPPFLPPPISVDPFKADSFIIVGVEGTNTEPVGPSSPNLEPVVVAPPLVPHPVFGPAYPIIPDLPPNVLPPEKIRPVAIVSSAIGDIPFQGGLHGDIAVRGNLGWILLAANLDGRILKTNGGGAQPSWQDA